MNLAKLLNLDKPLVILDLETTGTSVARDKIVQIAIIKIYPDGKETEWCSDINPGINIPNEVVEIHGIDNERVQSAPTFGELAPVIHKGLSDCYIGGYNVQFDIKFLAKAFDMLGADFYPGLVVDAFKIFTYHEPRDLTAAVKKFLGEDFKDAHDALSDTRATKRVLEAQFDHYPDFPRNMDLIHELLFEKNNKNNVEPSGKIVWRDGVAVLNFGNHATVPLFDIPRKYLCWMLKESGFSKEVKRIITEALNGEFPSK